MNPNLRGRAASLAVLFVMLAGAARLGMAFLDGPPLAVTGGFGEVSCHACHFDEESNPPGGSLAIEGLPDAYEPGRRYLLDVTLAREGMANGGFQLAARFADGEARGRRAGALRAFDERAAVLYHSSQDVEYAQHTEAGIALTGPGAASWRLEWTAPDAPAPVLFHLAGAAANGDGLASGDVVYTSELRTLPR